MSIATEGGGCATRRRAASPRRAWRSLLAMLLACGLAPPGVEAQRAAPTVPGDAAVVLSLQGAIGPATADYITRGLQQARTAGAPLVVLRIDTPGGLDTSMRDIVRAILASPVPVMAYVHPSGARAASAGTYILYASHVAAMTPGTNLGAATPVPLGGPSGEPEDEPRSQPRQEPRGTPGSAPRPSGALQRKAVNDATAYLRSLAELRGRDAAWAEEAVREGASLSATAALERGVIDLVARDLADALQQADGRSVSAGGRSVVLETRGLPLAEFEPNWRTRVLAAITDPNVALILLTIGVYGLLFEFLSPGALVPGIVGAIALLVGLYALSALPVNIAGIGLVVLGLGLIVAEAFTPTLGVLGIGGVVAFVVGATLLFDGEVPGFEISQPLLAGVAIGALGGVLLVAQLARRARRRPVAAGAETLVGGVARVLRWNGNSGYVHLEGERWAARSEAALAEGQAVRVVARDGLCLHVVPWETTPNHQGG